MDFMAVGECATKAAQLICHGPRYPERHYGPKAADPN